MEEKKMEEIRKVKEKRKMFWDQKGGANPLGLTKYRGPLTGFKIPKKKPVEPTWLQPLSGPSTSGPKPPPVPSIDTHQ